MKENSREEDIKIINNFITYFNKNIQNGNKADLTVLGEEINALEHILSDYKRVLKENEELKNDYENLSNSVVVKNHCIKNSIPVQKVKDIIDRIDYDIKKTKEIISKNTNIYASYRKNDYQIARLKAMNTKSLDIKKRLQELLESEE